MTTVCCFERIVCNLMICVYSGSCLSRNVSLMIQIWRELLILNEVMCQAFGHFDQ